MASQRPTEPPSAPALRSPALEPIARLLALLREAQVPPDDLEASRSCFLRGMRALLEADGASWVEPGAPQLFDGAPALPRSTSLAVNVALHRLAFHRTLPFSAEAHTLVGVLGEHSWLLERLLRSSAPHRLPRRLRQTLELLLAGHCEKDLAVVLGLSIHTVHDYVKQLYRRLDVSSRGELFAKVLRPAPVSAATTVVAPSGEPQRRAPFT